MEGLLGALPQNDVIQKQYRAASADPMVFDLTADEVAYLVSTPAGEPLPILHLPMFIYKAHGAPSDQKWGYALRIEQDGGFRSGSFSDGSSIPLTQQGFHLSGMRGFDEGYDFARYAIVMQFVEGAR